jgi:hypothetical protein
MIYLVSGELTAIDREFLSPQKEQAAPLAADEKDINGFAVRTKLVTRRNTRDYWCAFCKTQIPGKLNKCNRCNAHLIQYGNVDFMYKTRDKRRLGTGEEEALRHEYVKQQHVNRT